MSELGSPFSDLFPGGLLPFLFLLLAPQPPVQKIVGVPRDGVVLLVPVADLVHGPVSTAVVGRAVVADPVCHGLDQHGSAEGNKFI